MKRVGRPAKFAETGKRYSLGLKVTADVKRKLEARAKKSGRTQSQEAELRLEQSFFLEMLMNNTELLKEFKKGSGL